MIRVSAWVAGIGLAITAYGRFVAHDSRIVLFGCGVAAIGVGIWLINIRDEWGNSK